MRAYRTVRNPRRPTHSRSARSRGPASATTASCAHQRETENASVAPSVAAQIETGVPSAVPNSRPLAAASTGPGKSTTVSDAETAMNTSGPAAPKPSIQPRTRLAESDPESAEKRTEGGGARGGGTE